MAACVYCQQEFPASELRPYGPGGGLTCFPCATATPDREAIAEGAFDALMGAAAAASDIGSVIIDSRTSHGPNPLTSRAVTEAEER